MSFLDEAQLEELALWAELSDREVRSDLSIGAIKDENDYTSNFTSALRRNINTYSESGLSATSFLLQYPEEREMGADAAIVLSRGSESKVAVFEAKWPRFMKPNYPWDYEQTATGLSHFSDQLERQRRWNFSLAVFEMFYTESPPGTTSSYFNGEGSSCVWHDDAEEFRMNRHDPRAIWSQDELKKLLSLKKVSIADVMKDFGLCNQGKPIAMTEPLEIGYEFRLPRNLLAIRAENEPPPARRRLTRRTE